MKRLLQSTAALLLFAGAATPLSAADHSIDTTATVTKFCTIGAGAAATTGSLTPKSTIDLGTTIGATGITATASTVTLAKVVCNAPSNVTLESEKGALLGPAAATGLQNRINYNAVTTGLPTEQASVAATVATGTAAVTTGATAAQATPFGSTTIGIQVTPVAATDLVVGSYSDVLKVTFTPQ